MKKCNKCKIVKPESGFHKDKSRKDGLNPVCKDCYKKYHKKRYKENKQRERDRNKQWRENNPEKIKASSKKYYKTNKEKILAHYKEYRKKHPKREKSRKKVGYAVKEGLIKKAERCENCNTVKPLVGHHEDYNKPLDVIWLCNSCHQQLHITIEVKT